MVQYLVAGLANGSLYALLALGLVLTLRSSNVLNFAQGDLATLFAFVCYGAVLTLKLPFAVALALSLSISAVFGVLVYNVLIFPLRNRGQIALKFVALSFSLAILGVVSLIWGPESRTFPSPFPAASYQLAGIYIASYQLWMFVLCMISMGLVGAFLRYTDLGLAMRVAAENADVAQLLGVDLRLTGSLAWGAGAVLATITGVIVASGVYLSPTVMGLVVLKAFAALVLGGMVSTVGVVAGAFLIGILESVVAWLWTPLLQDSVSLVLVIVILLVSPGGLVRRGHVWRG